MYETPAYRATYVAPLYGIEIRIGIPKGDVESVRLRSSGEAIAYERTEEGIALTLPELRLHESVIVEARR